MTKIVFPLAPGMTGTEVRNLQAVLQDLLRRGAIRADDESLRSSLSGLLQREHAEQVYGTTTRELVSNFQRERRLDVSGTVDEPTANAFNRLLDELDAQGMSPSYMS